MFLILSRPADLQVSSFFHFLSLLILPEDRLNAEFTLFLNQTANVIAKYLTKSLATFSKFSSEPYALSALTSLMVKNRKFGDSVHSKMEAAMVIGVLCKILCHNI